jgi:hypothetical protein
VVPEEEKPKEKHDVKKKKRKFHRALSDVTFNIEPNTMTLLLGPPGTFFFLLVLVLLVLLVLVLLLLNSFLLSLLLIPSSFLSSSHITPSLPPPILVPLAFFSSFSREWEIDTYETSCSTNGSGQSLSRDFQIRWSST